MDNLIFEKALTFEWHKKGNYQIEETHNNLPGA